MVFYESTIESSFESVNLVVNEAMIKIESNFNQLNKHILFNINFMMREILNNAVEHGNHFDVNKKVYFKILYESVLLTFIVKDEGLGFDINKISVDNSDKNSLFRERQRGYQTLEKMNFDIRVNKNEVTIILNLDQEVKSWKNYY